MIHDGSDLAIIVPLWLRTEHIDRVTRSIAETTPGARVVFVVSEGDTTTIDAVIESGNRLMADLPPTRLAPDLLTVDGVGGEFGDYARKINAGYNATDEPFLFTGADDIVFHAGWYDAARAVMQDRLESIEGGDPDEFTLRRVGVVGTVDNCNARTIAGEHSTHSLVARWYADCCAVFDRPGAIYHDGYPHDYCDDELVGVARARGMYAHAHDAIVEHVHPNVGKAPDDIVYRRGRALVRMGKRRFQQRRRHWSH